MLFESVGEILDGVSGREVDSASFVAANGTLTTEELIGCGVRLLYRRGKKGGRKEGRKVRREVEKTERFKLLDR